MVCVCMQACRIRLPRLWWMDQVNATLQTPSRAHWTPNGISTMTCESPVPLLTTNTLSQFSRMWSFNNHFPIDFLFYFYLNVWIKMYIFFALFNNSLILWPLFSRKKIWFCADVCFNKAHFIFEQIWYLRQVWVTITHTDTRLCW